MFNSKKPQAPETNLAQDDSSPRATVPTARLLDPKDLDRFRKTTSRAGNEPSVISAGAVMKGSLISPGSVHSQGIVEGEIEAPHITLGENSEMKGGLKCQKLIVNGRFDGDIQSEEAVVGRAAIISGSITCATLQASQGSSITGKMQIGKRAVIKN